jgi:hypothetical protein
MLEANVRCWHLADIVLLAWIKTTNERRKRRNYASSGD